MATETTQDEGKGEEEEEEKRKGDDDETDDGSRNLGEQSTWHEATKTEAELLPKDLRFYLFIAEFDIDVGTKLKHAIPHCPPKNKPE